MCVTARRTFWAVFLHAFVSTVALRADSFEVFRKVLVQNLTVVHFLVQRTLLHDPFGFHLAPLLTFDARADQARRQPASILLGLIIFALVGEH